MSAKDPFVGVQFALVELLGVESKMGDVDDTGVCRSSFDIEREIEAAQFAALDEVMDIEHGEVDWRLIAIEADLAMHPMGQPTSIVSDARHWPCADDVPLSLSFR